MKIIMYHYVRSLNRDKPYFKFLDINDFKKQLDYFEQKYGFVSKDDFYACLDGKKNIPDGVVLTFDDGLLDHYDFVFPELKKRKLWGIFSVPTNPFQKNEILSVHKVHQLIGIYGGNFIYDMISRSIDLSQYEQGGYATQYQSTYSSQLSSDKIKQVKRLLNYTLPISIRTKLIDDLYSQYINKTVADTYMNLNQIKEMFQNGMIIANHGGSHILLSQLSKSDQVAEIMNSHSFFQNLLGKNWQPIFCYPYGGGLSFNSETLSILRELNVLCAFSVQSMDFSGDTSSFQKRYSIPRFDCNEFPYGKASSLK